MGKTESKNLSEFIRAINADADRECEIIKIKANRQKKERLDAASKELEKDFNEKILKAQKNIQSQINKEMTAFENEMRDELVKKRRGIEQTVFSKVEQKLKNFSKSEDYRGFICKSAEKISEALKGDGLVIYMRSEDAELAQAVKDAVGRPCEIAADDSIVLGGLKASTQTQAADDTLDKRLEDERAWFAENSGLKIV